MGPSRGASSVPWGWSITPACRNGRAIDFTPEGDASIRDGQGAIAIRSWQASKTRIRATSPRLRDGVLTVTTVSGRPFVAEVKPIVIDRPYVVYWAAPSSWNRRRDSRLACIVRPAPVPVRPPMAKSGQPDTSWSPDATEPHPWLVIDPERFLTYRWLTVRFSPGERYNLAAEAQAADGAWQALASAKGGCDTLDLPTAAVLRKSLRLTLSVGKGQS